MEHFFTYILYILIVAIAVWRWRRFALEQINEAIIPYDWDDWCDEVKHKKGKSNPYKQTWRVGKFPLLNRRTRTVPDVWRPPLQPPFRLNNRSWARR